MTKRRLLWIGDACVSTGFARATHYTLEALRQVFDVTVLGLNYHGDPHPYPYPVYPCSRDDGFGLGRVKELIQRIGPAVIVVQNDPWNIPLYIRHTGNVPVVGAIAVDGLHCQGAEMNGLASVIFWTKFGEEQAKIGGYAGSSTVIPLGVDQSIYSPQSRADIRERMNLPRVLENRGLPRDAFIVGVVGRNQPRKRLDLTIQYFAEWVHAYKVNDAVLWLHVAPTQDKAHDLHQLSKYYGVSDRLLVPDIDPIHGLPEESMAKVYSVFDVLLTTTLGEGFGLPMFEAAACGVPVIAPDWSALGELLKGVAVLVPCTTTMVQPEINTVGGVMDKVGCVQALDAMYRDAHARELYSLLGLARVSEPEYRWENIGRRFTDAVEQALHAHSTVDLREEVPA